MPATCRTVTVPRSGEWGGNLGWEKQEKQVTAVSRKGNKYGRAGNARCHQPDTFYTLAGLGRVCSTSTMLPLKTKHDNFMRSCTAAIIASRRIHSNQ